MKLLAHEDFRFFAFRVQNFDNFLRTLEPLISLQEIFVPSYLFFLASKINMDFDGM